MGKNVWEGNQALYQNKMNSPADFANWLSLGSVDMIRGTIAPEETFSKEHWQNRFRFFTAVAGVMVAKVNGGSAPKTVPTVRVPKKPANMPVIKSVTNTIEWFRANFLDFDLYHRKFAADGPGVGRSPSHTHSRAEVDGNSNGSSGMGIDNANDIRTLTVDDIPTAKSGNFNEFFNSLTSSELDELGKIKELEKN